MPTNELLALIGGIIIAGFLGNLVFKVTRIPSVIKLIGVGLLIGPVLGMVKSEDLFAVAPLFGKIALLIILFSGGMGLNIRTVVEQLGKSILLSMIVFGITFLLVYITCRFYIRLEPLQSVILGVLLGGNASAIVIPLVPGLSASERVKTLLSIESAISYLFIIVLTVMVCDFAASDNAGHPVLAFLQFFKNILIGLACAIVAGSLWGRLMGALKDIPYAYMLTLGFIFLLNFVVEDLLKASGALSILFFAIILSNMQEIVRMAGVQKNKRLRIRWDRNKFLLNDFVKGIAGELSFLVGTFFFVLLGALVTFDQISKELLLQGGMLILAVVAGRLIVLPLFIWMNRTTSRGEWVLMAAMVPRGLATAVMAFKPMEAQYEGKIPDTELFPLYCMVVILGSNLVMTALIGVGEAMLRRTPAVKTGSQKTAANIPLVDAVTAHNLSRIAGSEDPETPENRG